MKTVAGGLSLQSNAARFLSSFFLFFLDEFQNVRFHTEIHPLCYLKFRILLGTFLIKAQGAKLLFPTV